MENYSFAPVAEHGIIRVNGYIVWCGSMVRTKDGKCHLFLSMWEEKYGFEAWVTHSKIGYAVADTPEGKYEFRGIILDGSGKQDGWDRDVVHNPWIVLHNEKFYLFYTGNYGDGTYDGNRFHQQIGLAVAEDPEGLWLRSDSPLLERLPGSFENAITTNPSVCCMPDGRFIMIYKYASGLFPHNRTVLHGVAFADKPEGPWKRFPTPVFQKEGVQFAAEDPCVFSRNGKLYCIIKDMGSFYAKDHVRALIQFESADGLEWKPSEPVAFLSRNINFEAGKIREIHRLERPFLYLENGGPSVFFCAAKPDADRDEAFNIHMKAKV